jgi:hypothetical protein
LSGPPPRDPRHGPCSSHRAPVGGGPAAPDATHGMMALS